MSDEATERVTVAATPARCFEVATDFDAYPEWSALIKKVDVTDADEKGRGVLVRFWAEAMGRSTSYALRYDYSNAPGRLSWSLAEGDIEEAIDGEYVFEPMADHTELSYKLTVDLRVPMPGFVKRRVEGRILGAALHELKARAES